jgi:hypothetical protein
MEIHQYLEILHQQVEEEVEDNLLVALLVNLEDQVEDLQVIQEEQVEQEIVHQQVHHKEIQVG